MKIIYDTIVEIVREWVYLFEEGFKKSYFVENLMA